MIYSAGRDCPICFDSSDIVYLKNCATDQIFFACFSCGCAWYKALEWRDEFDILEPKAISPQGFVLANLTDIESADLQDLISFEYSEILTREIPAENLLKWLS
jgi:hypothetical protein